MEGEGTPHQPRLVGAGAQVETVVRKFTNYNFPWMARLSIIAEMQNQCIECLRVSVYWTRDQVIATMVPANV